MITLMNPEVVRPSTSQKLKLEKFNPATWVVPPDYVNSFGRPGFRDAQLVTSDMNLRKVRRIEDVQVGGRIHRINVGSIEASLRRPRQPTPLRGEVRHYRRSIQDRSKNPKDQKARWEEVRDGFSSAFQSEVRTRPKMIIPEGADGSDVFYLEPQSLQSVDKIHRSVYPSGEKKLDTPVEREVFFREEHGKGFNELEEFVNLDLERVHPRYRRFAQTFFEYYFSGIGDRSSDKNKKIFDGVVQYQINGKGIFSDWLMAGGHRIDVGDFCQALGLKEKHIYIPRPTDKNSALRLMDFLNGLSIDGKSPLIAQLEVYEMKDGEKELVHNIDRREKQVQISPDGRNFLDRADSVNAWLEDTFPRDNPVKHEGKALSVLDKWQKYLYSHGIRAGNDWKTYRYADYIPPKVREAIAKVREAAVSFFRDEYQAQVKFETFPNRKTVAHVTFPAGKGVKLADDKSWESKKLTEALCTDEVVILEEQKPKLPDQPFHAVVREKVSQLPSTADVSRPQDPAQHPIFREVESLLARLGMEVEVVTGTDRFGNMFKKEVRIYPNGLGDEAITWLIGRDGASIREVRKLLRSSAGIDYLTVVTEIPKQSMMVTPDSGIDNVKTPV